MGIYDKMEKEFNLSEHIIECTGVHHIEPDEDVVATIHIKEFIKRLKEALWFSTRKTFKGTVLYSYDEAKGIIDKLAGDKLS